MSARTIAWVVVAVVLPPVSDDAGVIFLCGVREPSGEFVVVIFLARDETITALVVIGFAFLAFVVRAAHGDI
jgi:hypothetical protein